MSTEGPGAVKVYKVNKSYGANKSKVEVLKGLDMMVPEGSM